ncbi:CBS domain-containing protein [Paenibacillus phyllosphaerae]|uniref:CBS domain-containing protein n=1 Tax=Paenibacillus phyllosphaerae TaxID=274593 RepID=A0A7W5FMQ5_9BACL|nr:CBS domain-containing protein [Paenibacillus phyllosphaerae]MBB3110485.1 CBS domain-containing protein [Paenibacillus phyllosphaerae]
MKTVKEIMSTDIVTATTKDNIYELAVIMKQHDIGFIPIVEGKKLIGVVTDRDLVIRGYAEKHSGSTSVSEVITTNIKTIESNISVDDAAKLMAQNQIRRLPVVESGELLGIVSIGDLAVREIFVNEAGEALSSISEQDHREKSANRR